MRPLIARPREWIAPPRCETAVVLELSPVQPGRTVPLNNLHEAPRGSPNQSPSSRRPASSEKRRSEPPSTLCQPPRCPGGRQRACDGFQGDTRCCHNQTRTRARLGRPDQIDPNGARNPPRAAVVCHCTSCTTATSTTESPMRFRQGGPVVHRMSYPAKSNAVERSTTGSSCYRPQSATGSTKNGAFSFRSSLRVTGGPNDPNNGT